MKFLVVLVSALVLVAHGNDTPSDEEGGIYEIKSEVVAGYAGQEAGGPQGVFAEEGPAVRVFSAEDEPRVGSPQEPQGVYAVEEPVAESVSAPKTGIYIPIVSRVCFNADCYNVCRLLGYKYGMCIGTSRCWCSN